MEDAKPKKQNKSDQLLDLIASLAKDVAKLTERVDAITAPPQTNATAPTFRAAPPAAPVVAGSQPIPVEYRQIVDTILNASFGIEIEACTDKPAFMFSILVPEAYTNTTPAYRAMYHEDRRMLVIPYAEGAIGVRQWTERVYNNFDLETRARIAADRAAQPALTH